MAQGYGRQRRGLNRTFKELKPEGLPGCGRYILEPESNL